MVSVIIRTKNEEQWIAHCLKMVFAQSVKDIEVVIVDNKSTDNTVNIAKRFPVKVVTVDKYLPGASINKGIRASKGEYVVVLSAHCIPKHNKWLENMLRNFKQKNLNVAGVYGRQIPFQYSSDVDKRDLMITFGLDKRIQEKDTFFHNANSVIRRDLWEKYPFNEKVTNIEDRVWAQQVIKKKYKIIYEPEAEVFHCHGIHHGNDQERYERTVKIMEDLHVELKGDLPETFKPGNINVVAFVPVIGKVQFIKRTNLLKKTIAELKECRFIKDIVVVSERDDVLRFARKQGTKAIKRGKNYLGKGKTLEGTLKYALSVYEKGNSLADAVLFVDYLFPFRPRNFFSELIKQYIYVGPDSAMASLKSYRTYWVVEDKNYRRVGDDLSPREEKDPIFEGLLGLGCISSSRFVRQGKLLGEAVELLDVKKAQYAMKVGDKYSNDVLAYLLDKDKKRSSKKRKTSSRRKR